jgi:hypothetical protein
MEADPHELYERARTRLEAGQLDEAAALLQKLHALIAARPEWDPDGTFARDLAPPLQARLLRLQDAAAALDAFCDRALKDVRPPDFKQDLSTVKDYTHWATAEVARLRSERDALVAQHLPNPEDAVLFTRTESYARSERLLEVDLLAKMSDAAGDDVLGLLSGDPRLESVLTRFRQLKRDLIEASGERDRLQARLQESETRDRALVGVLDALLGDGAGTPSEPVNVGARLARAVLARRDALLHRKRLSDAERALFDADLARYRLANRLIVAAGLGSDQRVAVAKLERALAALPHEKAPPAAEAAPVASAPAPVPRAWPLAGITAALVTLLLVRAVLSGVVPARRPAPSQSRPEPWNGDETQPLDTMGSGGGDAGRRAA